MTYTWRMEPAGPLAAEFTIQPASGHLVPQEQQVVTVEWEPASIQKCKLSLALDVQGVQETMGRVEVVGECALPRITLAEEASGEKAGGCRGVMQGAVRCTVLPVGKQALALQYCR